MANHIKSLQRSLSSAQRKQYDLERSLTELLVRHGYLLNGAGKFNMCQLKVHHSILDPKVAAGDYTIVLLNFGLLQTTMLNKLFGCLESTLHK